MLVGKGGYDHSRHGMKFSVLQARDMTERERDREEWTFSGTATVNW